MVAGVLVLVLALMTTAAWAQEEQPGKEGPLQERLQRRWETVSRRIELVITRFENNQDRHAKAYEKAKGKVEAFLEEMSAKGYDVSKLSQDLETWDGMFQKFSQDYAALIEKLKEIAALTPEQAQGQFMSLLREAREMLRTVRQDALDIRLFYQQTIRADIQELREQLPEAA